MKRDFQRGETRSEVIFRHTRRQLHDLRLSMATFGQRVVEKYHELVPWEVRCVEFRTVGDAHAAMTINAQKLHRYMELEVNARMPVDLEEAWVEALAEPYHTECVRDLARRYGLLDVPLPAPVSRGDVQSVVKLTKEFAEALAAVAPILEDGRITPNERALVPGALLHIDALIGAAHGIRARLEAAVPSAGARVVAIRKASV